MALPAPLLDDRRFQDIVDQAKLLIPRYCPEWTDHNVSDPGVALIELFAWMTEMLLYRVNQVPDKTYIKFLEMIGVTLQPPRAAMAPVTMYLSASQPVDVSVPMGTEVATVRTETSQAITFTTEADLVIRPTTVLGAYTRRPEGGGSSTWTTHDLRELGLPDRRISLFPLEPAPGDAFYLSIERDHSNHVVALVMACETAGGTGVDPNDPPLEWQVWQGEPTRWANCEVEYDGTGGFNYSGEIVLHLPAMLARELNEGAFQGPRSYWLRCRLTEPKQGQGRYRASPAVERLRVEARGGTVAARQATTVLHEQLGQSDGTPGQKFTLRHTPILARDPERDYLVVEPPTGEPEHWTEVPDFGASGPNDHHFTLDSLEGTLTLGPSLLQSDGTVYSFGATPVRGANLVLHRYQYGGGVEGNVPAGTLRVLKTAVPYVTQVSNRQPAQGGRGAQTIENAKLDAPRALRTRTRAVTADDFEYLTAQITGVARARCLTPGAQPGAQGDPLPGQVVMIVLPQIENTSGRIPAEQLTLSAELRNDVLNDLEHRRLIGTTLDVRQPQYVYVSVDATLRLPERSHEGLVREVRQRAEDELYRFLNPYVGGAQGDGWPFGRDLHVASIYGVLQRVPSVEFVDQVRVRAGEQEGAAELRQVDSRLTLQPNALICSAQHTITVVVG
jgi:predicted phage baseplate assembly protein